MEKTSTSRLHAYARSLCSIGVKFAGTRGEIRARNYIVRSLSSLGVRNVSLEEFDYVHYQPQDASCEILARSIQRLAAEPLQYTANGRVEGSVVYVGSGAPEDFEQVKGCGRDLGGKIVVAAPRRTYVTYELAQANGARGFICICDAPEDLIRAGTATNNRRPGSIPGVLISLRDGHRLLSFLSASREGRVSIHSRGQYSKKKSWNIVGRIEGTRWPDRRVLLCAHYDSQNKGCGAWDDVSGNVGLLGIAEFFVKKRPRSAIELAFFGVEEQGLCWGSSSFIEVRRSDLASYVAAINFDGLSSILCPLKILEVSREARRFAVMIAKAGGWVPDHVRDPTPTSDHKTFAAEGIPVIWPHEGPRSPYQHTERDVLEFLDMERLERTAEVGRLCAEAIARQGRVPVVV